MSGAYLLLLFLTGTAAVFDIRSQKIPNLLIITGGLLGFSYQFSGGGWSGGCAYFSGVFLTMLLPGLLYVFRMIGAGDVKLLGVIGGFLGPADGFRFMIFTFLVGGVISAALLIQRRNLFSRFFYLKTYISQYLQTREWSPYRKEGCEDGYLHFSVPTLISLICFLGGVY